ncbi:MAG: UpxY family transcription antiterminator [Syntrophales bacterium]|nr:UpxY family transcription antiterminator [Syntrophales bacterium]
MLTAAKNSIDSADLKKWYAVYTRSRHEEKVYTGFKNKDFEVFLPKAETWSRRKDRRKTIRVPLFPGYIFVHSHLNNYTRQDILKTTGVVRIIGIKGCPTPVPEEEITSLKLMVDSGQPVFPLDYIKTGDKVTVIDGPLEGAVGSILSSKSKKKTLVVSIHLLHRSIAVEMDEWAIQKISS